MNKRQIAFKGSFSNGAEHTDYLTIHDNYQGTRRAAVVVDKHAMYTPADIDALIAALREARDALAGDAARPRDDGAVVLDEKPRILSSEEWDYLARRATPTAKQPDAPRSNAAAAVMLGDKLADKLEALDAAPSRATDDAPVTPDEMTRLRQDVLEKQAIVDELMAQPNPMGAECETRSAATVRLTRAQREALEQIIDRGGWLPKYRISGEAPAFRDIRNSQLANREFRYDMEGYAITDAGRTALAAAQRETDDARDATHDGGGEQ